MFLVNYRYVDEHVQQVLLQTVSSSQVKAIALRFSSQGNFIFWGKTTQKHHFNSGTVVIIKRQRDPGAVHKADSPESFSYVLFSNGEDDSPIFLSMNI